MRGKLHKAPAYFVVGPRGEALVPEIGRDGFINDDYLLISRVPNIAGLEKQGDPRLLGKNVLSFQGVHGTATRCLELFFSDKNLLREMKAGLPKSGYFQAIVKLATKHDRRRNISEPDGPFRLIDIVEVEFQS